MYPNRRFRVVEIWEPACMMAVPKLAAISDSDEFERQAFRWIEANQARIAADIADERHAFLVNWRHEPDFADNTPFGATIVLLESRSPHSSRGVDRHEAGGGNDRNPVAK